MKAFVRLFVALLIVANLTSCFSIRDRSAKYRDIIGKRFVTRFDYELWKMKYAQYDIVPYRLQPPEYSEERYGTKVAFIPVGTLITVRNAKVSFIGGDWNFLLCELVIPGSHEKIVFEEMMGFSSVDPALIFQRWAPVEAKTAPTNHSSQRSQSRGRLIRRWAKI